MNDYEWRHPWQGLALCTIASFSILGFLFVEKQTCKLQKNLEQIIVGSQLAVTAFSGLNAFIYKLALEWGITPNFTVKYSWGASACSVFNVSGVSSYCKREIKDSHTVLYRGGWWESWERCCYVSKKKEKRWFDIICYNDVCLVKWPQLFKLHCQHVLFTL